MGENEKWRRVMEVTDIPIISALQKKVKHIMVFLTANRGGASGDMVECPGQV